MESEWELDRMRLYQLRREHPDLRGCTRKTGQMAFQDYVTHMTSEARTAAN